MTPVSTDELVAILDSFPAGDFTEIIHRGRQIVQRLGISCYRGDRLVPGKEIRDVYRSRASNPCIPQFLRQQDWQIARAAEQYLDEHWCIYAIHDGERGCFLLFTNDAHVGRACIDFDEVRQPQI